MLESNTGRDGSLDTDAFQIAMLQYRNTPDPSTKMSPAMCVFGRSIRDFIPVSPGQYNPNPEWERMLDAREEALRERRDRAGERWNEHTKRLPPLKVGDNVRLQNQTGPHPNKWDRTGCVVEVRQHDQYVIRVNGSGRQTVRNRQFLRLYTPRTPLARRIDIADDLRYLPEPVPEEVMVSEPQTAVTIPVEGNEECEAMPLPQSSSLTPPPSVTTTTMELTPTPPPSVTTTTMELTPTTTKSTPTTTTTTVKKPPLALRRLASYNKEGRIGLTLQDTGDRS